VGFKTLPSASAKPRERHRRRPLCRRTALSAPRAAGRPSGIDTPGGAPIDADALRAHFKARLASFEVPREFLMLREDEFPLTANGKARSADLRAIAEARLKT